MAAQAVLLFPYLPPAELVGSNDLHPHMRSAPLILFGILMPSESYELVEPPLPKVAVAFGCGHTFVSPYVVEPPGHVALGTLTAVAPLRYSTLSLYAKVAEFGPLFLTLYMKVVDWLGYTGLGDTLAVALADQ